MSCPQKEEIKFGFLNYQLHRVHHFELEDADDSLTKFIINEAEEFDRQLIAKTFVATVNDRVVGFISTTCSEVKIEDSSTDAVDSPINNFLLKPAIKIVRFAVDRQYQGCGIGGNLLSLCMAIVLDDIVPYIGCRYLVLDARPERVDWYQSYGFELIDTYENIHRDHPLMFVDLLDMI